MCTQNLKNPLISQLTVICASIEKNLQIKYYSPLFTKNTTIRIIHSNITRSKSNNKTFSKDVLFLMKLFSFHGFSSLLSPDFIRTSCASSIATYSTALVLVLLVVVLPLLSIMINHVYVTHVNKPNVEIFPNNDYDPIGYIYIFFLLFSIRNSYNMSVSMYLSSDSRIKIKLQLTKFCTHAVRIVSVESLHTSGSFL